ncbi:hypothetical protein [Nocardia tengchongensis]
MDKQATVTLIVGLSAALATAVGATLAYRNARRDERDYLKRDLERYGLMPESWSVRDELGEEIQRRERLRMSQEEPRRLTRIALYWASLVLAGTVAMNVSFGGYSWVQVTNVVLGYVMVYGTFVSILIWMIAGFRAAMSWINAGSTLFLRLLLCIVYVPLTAVVLIVWSIVRFRDSLRVRLGYAPLMRTSLGSVFTEFWPFAKEVFGSQNRQ